MKKIIIFILSIIILTAILTGVAILKPNIKRTCKIDKYNISLKIPYAYEKLESESENNLLNLYSEFAGISISAFDLKDDFWSSGDTMTRVDEYIQIMSAANYDAEIKNIETSILSEKENRAGKAIFEMEKVNSTSKLISIVTNEEIGNVVIEISGSAESMKNNEEELEKIISSLTIK